MTEPMVAKRLAFEDLSVTLSSLVDGGAAADIKVKLAELVSTYEQHRKRSEERLDDARDQAVKLAQSMPRQAPSKHQLRGLKSSLLNLTQKELFAQALLNCNDQLELRLDGDECTAATLKSTSEDLKDLKKQNKQAEEQLQCAVSSIDAYQQQHQQLLARVAMKLEMTTSELAALESSSRAPPASPLPAAVNVNEEDIDAKLAQQSQQAMTLEASLASAEAACRDLEADVQAQQSDVCHVEAEIARLKAHKEDEARVAEQRHKEALAWCDSMTDILALTTGVTLVSIGEDVITVRIEQLLPEELQANGKTQLEHTLTAHLQPGSSLLHSASLEPPCAELAQLVQFAKETGGGVPLLLSMVRSLTFDRWREARAL